MSKANTVTEAEEEREVPVDDTKNIPMQMQTIVNTISLSSFGSFG